MWLPTPPTVFTALEFLTRGIAKYCLSKLGVPAIVVQYSKSSSTNDAFQSHIIIGRIGKDALKKRQDEVKKVLNRSLFNHAIFPDQVPGIYPINEGDVTGFSLRLIRDVDMILNGIAPKDWKIVYHSQPIANSSRIDHLLIAVPLGNPVEKDVFTTDEFMDLPKFDLNDPDTHWKSWKDPQAIHKKHPVVLCGIEDKKPGSLHFRDWDHELITGQLKLKDQPKPLRECCDEVNVFSCQLLKYQHGYNTDMVFLTDAETFICVESINYDEIGQHPDAKINVLLTDVSATDIRLAIAGACYDKMRVFMDTKNPRGPVTYYV
ncbi:hypothetical protein BD410DRAFT_841767 [Rickenella mellea]|uniref:Uncharacterized protein n=1 Tax=Rickenella mellea TaxID=50990 RepID=A0A4Y7PH40_9AGAM|nr:hypothetical protein BD410DRAFT_845741 [Rickenella mellea]TDL19791.1 hypothetical protein BD410DRAFT_841767 [Rickenella mellea]